MDKKNWLDKFQDKLKERKNNFSTSSGIKIDRFFTLNDIDKKTEDKNSLPGQFPFVRGVQPTMYRGRFGLCDSMQDSDQQKKQIIDLNIF